GWDEFSTSLCSAICQKFRWSLHPDKPFMTRQSRTYKFRPAGCAVKGCDPGMIRHPLPGPLSISESRPDAPMQNSAPYDSISE
ncbi:MAG: hypothetical protein VYE29_00005, partial [Pseudomonadota bacterium]|nr:hypothetical protein [Pseudomonadota bacterium]